MLRIAICDDETKAVLEQKLVVKNCLKDYAPLEISTFTDGVHLMFAITEDQAVFDIILLDIEMPTANGMLLSKSIHQMLPSVKIILVTSHLKYVLDAFALPVFRYVPKAHIQTRLPEVLLDAAKMVEKETADYLVIQDSRRLERVPLRDILYIERDGHYAVIVTELKRFRARSSLMAVARELDPKRFTMISQSSIVNLLHVRRLKDKGLELSTDVVLPISRSHLKDIRRKVVDFWGDIL